jgi:hypothetical protein
MPLTFAVTLVVPDAVWLDCLDPLATGMEADLGLDPDHPQDRYRRHVYADVTVAQARDFVEYADGRARTILSDCEDPPSRRVARQTIAVCDALLAQLGEGS